MLLQDWLEQLGEFLEAHHALRDFFSYAPQAYAAMVKRFSVSIQRIGAILAALRPLLPFSPLHSAALAWARDFLA